MMRVLVAFVAAAAIVACGGKVEQSTENSDAPATPTGSVAEACATLCAAYAKRGCPEPPGGCVPMCEIGPRLVPLCTEALREYLTCAAANASTIASCTEVPLCAFVWAAHPECRAFGAR